MVGIDGGISDMSDGDCREGAWLCVFTCFNGQGHLGDISQRPEQDRTGPMDVTGKNV